MFTNTFSARVERVYRWRWTQLKRVCVIPCIWSVLYVHGREHYDHRLGNIDDTQSFDIVVDLRSIAVLWVSILTFSITSTWIRRILCLNLITWFRVIATLIGPVLSLILWAAILWLTLRGAIPLLSGARIIFYSSPFYYSPCPSSVVVCGSLC